MTIKDRKKLATKNTKKNIFTGDKVKVVLERES